MEETIIIIWVGEWSEAKEWTKHLFLSLPFSLGEVWCTTTSESCLFFLKELLKYCQSSKESRGGEEKKDKYVWKNGRIMNRWSKMRKTEWLRICCLLQFSCSIILSSYLHPPPLNTFIPSQFLSSSFILFLLDTPQLYLLFILKKEEKENLLVDCLFIAGKTGTLNFLLRVLITCDRKSERERNFSWKRNITKERNSCSILTKCSVPKCDKRRKEAERDLYPSFQLVCIIPPLSLQGIHEITFRILLWSFLKAKYYSRKKRRKKRWKKGRVMRVAGK